MEGQRDSTATEERTETETGHTPDETEQRERVPLYFTASTGEGEESQSTETDRPTEPKRKRARRSDYGTTRTGAGNAGTRSTRGAARQRLADLTDALAMGTVMTFRVPAYLRTQQWGVQRDERGQPVVREEHGQQVPVGMGDFWLVSQEEAYQFGGAWAKVIDAYMPEELVSGTAIASGAIMATVGLLMPRVIIDQSYAQQFRALERERQALQAAQNGAHEPGHIAQAADMGAN